MTTQVSFQHVFQLTSIRAVGAMALLAGASAAQAHVSLADPAALAGTSYRATLRVGHGCDGSPVTAVRVSIPSGFIGAKPMPKPGWTLTLKSGKLDVPYDDHGKAVTEGLTEVTWTAKTPDDALQDAWFDEFVVRGMLPKKSGTMAFKVLQTCAQGSIDWADVPAPGKSAHDLKSPAAMLDIIASEASAHSH